MFMLWKRCLILLGSLVSCSTTLTPLQDAYYRSFYVSDLASFTFTPLETHALHRRGCSGNFDISVSDNPFERRPKPSVVFVNLTTPPDITGPSLLPSSFTHLC
jgi:hypothetical protein